MVGSKYRHGHLILFDDEEQLEVRHVISLAHHDISIYSGGDVTPEGELFIKRNALCLSRRSSEPSGSEGEQQLSKPFYLFSENCSAKEDFYFALLKNQAQTFPTEKFAPKPSHFDVKAIISLVQKLHSSESNIHSRWLNAMAGRIFLAIYRTRDLEYLIAEKITKKISRVKKPSFLTNIAIRKIDTGEAAPYFTNMKLKDLTVEGECVMEADVKYTGNFRLEVAATAKIDLGTRFKAREVNLVLSVMVKRVEGHMLFKVKAPPSNRIWFSFQTMPKMEMTIEPIVSSRQITYTVILRQIENRIKEVIAETLVLPFWDDVPFFRTEHKKWRGGIFEGDNAVVPSEDIDVPLPHSPPTAAAAADSTTSNNDIKEDTQDQDILQETVPLEKSQTMPSLDPQPATTGLFGRKINKTGTSSPASTSSMNLDSRGQSTTTSRSLNPIRNAAEPIVGTETAHADLFIPSSSPPDQATNMMAALHSRAQDLSPVVSPVGSPEKSSLAKMSSQSSISSKEINEDEPLEDTEVLLSAAEQSRRNTISSIGSGSLDSSVPQSPTAPNPSTGSLGRNFFTRRDTGNSVAGSTSTTDSSQQKRNTLAAVTNAAAQARQWGWNAIQRQKENKRNGEPLDLSQPFGRGQPLPPPGVPLPGPTNNGRNKATPIPMPQRKNHTPPLPERPSPEIKDIERDIRLTASPNPPPRRRRGTSLEHDDEDDQPMLIVAIPDDSEPGTPATDEKPAYFGKVTDTKSKDQRTKRHTGASLENSPSNLTKSIIAASKPLKSDSDKAPATATATADAGDTGTSTPDSKDLPSDGEPIMALPIQIEDDFSNWMEDSIIDDDDANMTEEALKEILPAALANKVAS